MNQLVQTIQQDLQGDKASAFFMQYFSNVGHNIYSNITFEETKECNSYMELGYFYVPTGQLIVSDPCYESGNLFIGKLLDVYCGRWLTSVMYRIYPDIGTRVTRLIVKSERYQTSGNLVANLEPFRIYVDSGCAGFFDIAHFQCGNANGSFCKLWYDYCRRKIRSPYYAGAITCGAVASAGFGDGEYTCISYRDNNNIMHMAELIFIVD